MKNDENFNLNTPKVDFTNKASTNKASTHKSSTHKPPSTLLQINSNFKITYSFDIAQSSYTQLRNLNKINDDHDFGDDGEDENNEDSILRKMLEGGNEKRDKAVKRQMKLVLKWLNRNGSDCELDVDSCDGFEKEAWNGVKTERLVVGTVLGVKGRLHFVNNVLMLTKDSVRVVEVASKVDTEGWKKKKKGVGWYKVNKMGGCINWCGAGSYM